MPIIIHFTMTIKVEYVFDVPDNPYDPTSQSALPYTSYGQSEKGTRRCCQTTWFTNWSIRLVLILICHACCKALKTKKVDLMKGNWESLFIVNGFSNWKDSTRIFKKHNASDVHKHAVEKLHNLPRNYIGESLNTAHKKERQMNRNY